MRNYDDFMTQAFIGYGIPPEILRVVQPWVEQHCRGFMSVTDDLGYAELRDIRSLDQAMNTLAEDLEWQRITGPRTYKKYIKTAGGREGHGFYRWALKAYYLMEAPCPVSAGV